MQTTDFHSQPLRGKVALVAGATRGAGRGIACALGEAGATVYCTGRSSRQMEKATPEKTDETISPFALEYRPETIEETAELVTERGGIGIPVRTDHTVESEVQALFERINREAGKLDILINDVWGGDALTEWGKPFWELKPENAAALLTRSVWSHILTSRYAAPMMVERKEGLIVEITDTFNFGYNGNLHYDLVKFSVIRLAFTMSEELRPHGVTALAVTPGFLRSEAMLEHFGVTEQNWEEGGEKDRHFLISETPLYVGRGVAAIASDPDLLARSGKVFSSWELAREYGFIDADGREPNFGEHFLHDEELRAHRENLMRSHRDFVGNMRTLSIDQ